MTGRLQATLGREPVPKVAHLIPIQNTKHSFRSSSSYTHTSPQPSPSLLVFLHPIKLFPGMRRLHMPIQIRPHPEVLPTQRTRKRLLARMRAHVHLVARRPVERAVAERAGVQPSGQRTLRSVRLIARVDRQVVGILSGPKRGKTRDGVSSFCVLDQNVFSFAL